MQGVSKQRLGRICKNLFDFARLKYIKEIKVGDRHRLDAKLFYYIEPDVTLENTMIKIDLVEI